MLISLLFFNIVLEGLATVIREEEKIEEIQVVKEEVKLSLYEADMILYIENPKDATSKILELINEMTKLLSICLLRKKYIHVFCPFLIDDEDDEL